MKASEAGDECQRDETKRASRRRRRARDLVGGHAQRGDEVHDAPKDVGDDAQPVRRAAVQDRAITHVRHGCSSLDRRAPQTLVCRRRSSFREDCHFGSFRVAVSGSQSPRHETGRDEFLRRARGAPEDALAGFASAAHTDGAPPRTRWLRWLRRLSSSRPATARAERPRASNPHSRDT